ncbi:MAG: PD40 domain-containing protein [Bacteroidales bacterium]|nr:PD40 domain-containing protein [Bacteroidales bacterium]
MTRKALLTLTFLLSLAVLHSQNNIDYLLNCQCGTALTSSQTDDLRQAFELYNAKRLTQSIRIARQVMKQAPQSPHPYFLMGLIYAKRENLMKVSAMFKKVNAICPDYPDARAHFFIGMINYSNEEFGRATDNLNRFFELAANDPQGIYAEYREDAEIYRRWSAFLNNMATNPVPFEPKSMTNISTPHNDLLPYRTVDGSQFWLYRFIPKYKTESLGYQPETQEKVLKLFQCRLLPYGNYSEGKVMGTPFNRTGTEGGVTLTADNHLLFYSIIKKESNGYNNSDIFFTEFKGGRWQPAENIGPVINNANSSEAMPSVTPDGSRLYFSSNRKGGLGGDDIWCSERQPDGSWGAPYNLGSTVNTSGDERFPFICADGETLFFSSNGQMCIGGYDVFYVRLDGRNTAPAKNLGYPINTDADEVGFGITADGTKAYFSSNRYPGKGGMDIFEFELYPQARPKRMIVLKGSAIDKNGNAIGDKITVVENNTKKRTEFPLNARNGHFTVVVKAECGNDISLWQNGRCLATKKVGIDTAGCRGEIVFLRRK